MKLNQLTGRVLLAGSIFVDELLALRGRLLWLAPVGFGIFVVWMLGVAIQTYLTVPGEARPRKEESWVETANRLERDNNQAAVKACLEAGGVPIFSSTWHSKITDCKFRPKE